MPNIYTLTTADETMAQRSSDSAFIPWDKDGGHPLDVDGAVHRQWIDDGSPAAAPYLEPPAPPATRVTRTQGLIQLHRAGLYDAYNQALAAADVETQIWAANEPTWTVDNPYLTRIAAALKLTEDQVQALFDEGSKIT